MMSIRVRVREKDFQRAVIDLAQLGGWLHYHVPDSRRAPAGFPDLVLVHPTHGQLLFRELKTTKGRLKTGQRTWLEALQKAGVNAQVWRPDDWKDIEQTLLSKRDKPHV